MDITPLGIWLCVQLYAIDSVPCGVSLICVICDICVTYNCLCALLVKVQVEATHRAVGFARGEAITQLEVAAEGADVCTGLGIIQGVVSSQEQDAVVVFCVVYRAVGAAHGDVAEAGLGVAALLGGIVARGGSGDGDALEDGVLHVVFLPKMKLR